MLTPKDRVVQPTQVAHVPKDPTKWNPETFDWKPNSPKAFVVLPQNSDEALLVDFGLKIAGHLILHSNEKQEVKQSFQMNCVLGPVLDLAKIDSTLQYDSECGIWRDSSFKALRYLLLSTNDSTPRQLGFESELTHWPHPYEGWFRCSDDQLNRIWYTGAYTIQICTHPHEESGCYLHPIPREYGDFPRNWRSKYGTYVIWDAPRRDREVWIGDMWPECLSLLYSFRAPEVMKTSLHAVATRQKPDGQIPGSGITL